MTNATPNFGHEGHLDPIIPADPEMEKISESIKQLIEKAPEKKLSPNVSFEHPDGTIEFIPEKDLHARFGDPSVEFVDEDGNVIVEHLGEETGKFESIGIQPHIEQNKKPDDYDPNQKEFGFALDGSTEKELKKPEGKKGFMWFEQED